MPLNPFRMSLSGAGCFMLALILGTMPGFATTAHAETTTMPPRVALPALNQRPAPPPEAVFHCALGIHLRERLGEMPGFTLISDRRLTAILDSLIGDAIRVAPEAVPAAFRAIQPAEIVIHYEHAGDGLRLIVDTPTRKVDTHVKLSGIKSLRGQVNHVAQMIGQALELNKAAMAVLLEDRIGGTVEDFLAYQEGRARPLGNATYADQSLKLIDDRGEKLRNNPYFAQQVFLRAPDIANHKEAFDYWRSNWPRMTVQFLPGILGSRFEADAYPLIRSHPTVFAAALSELVKPLSVTLSGPMGAGGLGGLDDDADALDFSDVRAGSDSLSREMRAMTRAARPDGAAVTGAQRAGALRALGLTGSDQALAVLLETSKHHDARVRQAAAVGLSLMPEDRGRERLRELLADSDAAVVWVASHALWTLGETTPKLLSLARTMMAGNPAHRREAQAVLIDLAEPSDLPTIRQMWRQRPAGMGHALLRARLRLGDIRASDWPVLLQDADEAVILTALELSAPMLDDPAIRAEIERMIADPYRLVAQGARSAMMPLRPADGIAQAAFDLTYEETYLQWRALERLAADKSPEAIALIDRACENADPHTRAEAMMHLARLDPKRAGPRALAMINDPHRWVAFHAATLASQLADPSWADVLKARHEVVSEPAERLYLEIALARAGVGEPPAPRTPARSIAGKRNLAWNTSPGMHSDISPFDAYYSMKVRADAFMRTAYAAGKIIFGRATPIYLPGMAVLNRTSRDSFWLDLESQVTLDDLAVLDGFIYGEESMSMQVSPLWPDGWRAFCIEAGIDVHRVRGDLENLNPVERRAWEDWAGARNVQGFNRLHDFTKLKYGILKPGFQVGTFLTGSDGMPHPPSSDAIPQLKFDLGGVYDYKGDNRMAGYNLIRRFKTLWPERPVLWLSLGIGGYEMNPVRHTQRVPDRPMLDRYDRAYSDSLTAWIAGADTGWFSTWMFVAPDFNRTGMARLRGVHLWVEDLGPNTRLLERGIAHTFRGVEKIEIDKDGGESPDVASAMSTVNLAQGAGSVRDILTEHEAQDAADVQYEAVSEEVRERRQRFKEGFLFYQRYIYDCARIFASLPRTQLQPKALAVRYGANVWLRPTRGRPLVPGQSLLSEYDYLVDVNMLANLDLDRYRYIVIHRPEALRDATIARITRWLRETPGLLVVHIDLTSDNHAKAGTVNDHQGPLLNDWPWEADIDRHPPGTPGTPGRRLTDTTLTTQSGTIQAADLTIESHWEIRTGHARPLVHHDGQCLLALWRHPDFRGAVIFDGVSNASAEYIDNLRGEVNQLASEHGIGLTMAHPTSVEVFESEQIQAVAGSRYFRSVRGHIGFEGLEIMTGTPSPEISGRTARLAALVARNFVGRFVAASTSLTAIADDPFVSARIEGDDLILHATGLVRIASATDVVTVIEPASLELPKPENPVEWLLFSKEEGIARFQRRAGEPTITYIRTSTPIRLRAGTLKAAKAPS